MASHGSSFVFVIIVCLFSCLMSSSVLSCQNHVLGVKIVSFSVKMVSFSVEECLLDSFTSSAILVTFSVL